MNFVQSLAFMGAPFGIGFVFEIITAIEAFGFLEALLRLALLPFTEKFPACGDQSAEFLRIDPDRVTPQ